jgi:hypothetical protein
MDHAQEQGMWAAIGRVEAETDALRDDVEKLTAGNAAPDAARSVLPRLAVGFAVGVGKLAFWLVLWWWVVGLMSVNFADLRGDQRASCQTAGEV